MTYLANERPFLLPWGKRHICWWTLVGLFLFDLKGRFCQPRPQAWEPIAPRRPTLKGSFDLAPPVSAGTDLSGPLGCSRVPPGLRPGLTEPTFQVGKTATHQLNKTSTNFRAAHSPQKENLMKAVD